MAELGVPAVLGLVGMIILVGLAGEWIFKKTGVPNAIILIGLGVLLGPVLGVVSSESMTAAAPFFGTLALLIILFDGGLNLKILKVVREAPFALLYTTLVFCASAAAVAVVYQSVFGGDWTVAFLLGVILGGTTGAVVIPVVTQMKSISDETRILLSLESAFTDVFVVVAALIFVNLLVSPTSLETAIVPLILHAFVDALLLALVAGMLWARFMGMLQGQPLSYMLTLAAVLLLYSAAEALGANGAITILFFGLVLGNMEEVVARAHAHVRRIIGWNLEVANFAIDVFLRRLNEELSFLVRTFFYVLLGLIFNLASLTPLVAAGSLLLFLAVLGCRWGLTAGMSLLKRSWSPRDRRTIVAMLPRGLSAAVMAFVPAAQGVPNTEAFPLYALLMIGFSILHMTVSLYLQQRRDTARAEAPAPPSFEDAAQSPAPPQAPRWAVFTELDGALLDPTTFRFDESRPALDRLQKEGVPLVICSGKTRAEIEYLRREIGNRDPFIVESGGAVYIPEGYFPALPAPPAKRNGYDVLEYGVPYTRLREALRTIESAVDLKLTGFGDMTIEEIVRHTGLEQPGAERARQREYDEPFVLNGGVPVTPETLGQIRDAAAELGLTVVAGVRFLHLTGGTDKGRACRALIELFRKQCGSGFRTAAFGSTSTDIAMLKAVDRPFLVARSDGPPGKGLLRLERLTHLPGAGPSGWAEGINRLLNEASPTSATP
ncbi:MAG: cation:proton antiporter [Nitrospirota bacterium]